MNLQDQNGGRTAGDRDILLRGRACVPELILSWGTFHSHENDFFDFFPDYLINRPDIGNFLKDPQASPQRAVESDAAGI